MSSDPQTFGFFFEDLRATDRVGPACAPESSLPWAPLLPHGASHLLIEPDSDAPTISSTRSDGALTAEVIHREFQSYVVLVTPEDSTVRINGLPAGPVSVLKIADQVRVDDFILHLSVHHTPYCGPPAESEIGTKCLVCYSPIREDNRRIYRCVYCGLPLHYDGEEHEASVRLECAVASSECPRCHQRLLHQEGFAYVPND